MTFRSLCRIVWKFLHDPLYRELVVLALDGVGPASEYEHGVDVHWIVLRYPEGWCGGGGSAPTNKEGEVLWEKAPSVDPSL